ncbi:hypothetical protein L484_014208 [Morus notabilis]|uniref:Membrane-associated kinase regulator 5 n=1 Tax=Morus notabilis TaxID=981085 RepID=W9SGR9_9ROSA|nr:probable membrane-associated kinase regulator 5 [Morus notabilis]EXC05940.1 hypothetical protein L484_014208 [Morus notabilis]
MEGLHFLKFWKPTTAFPTPLIEVDNEEDEQDEEEDSFFDLELTAPDFDTKKNDSKSSGDKTTKSFHLNEETKPVIYPKPSLLLSPIDPIPKRKILPLEPIPKPQSPMALLKSAPTFRVFSFKKSRSTGTTQKAGETAAKFNAGESPKLSRETSSRRTERFSKDVITKYLKLVKPLYVKVSKRYNGEKMNNSSAADLFVGFSPSSSPATVASPKDKPAGIRKHLRKSKSSSATAVPQTTSNRRDDSLLQQHDGIQSAILHCKRSFNSSRDSCSLSRSTSDSSSMKSYSTDSYRLSNSASETSHDNSARNSIEDVRGIGI